MFIIFLTSLLPTHSFGHPCRHNPTGKVFTRTELSSLADVCIRHSILILVDEVYDTMSFTPFVRIGSLSPEAYAQTLTVGSAGKTFYATGWRVGHVIGPADLIEPVAEAHRLICYSSPSASQQVVAAAHEAAHANGFFEWSRKEIERKMTFFNEVWTELGIRVRHRAFHSNSSLHTPD